MPNCTIDALRINRGVKASGGRSATQVDKSTLRRDLMLSAKKNMDVFLASIGYPLLIMSGVGLHLFTAFTAYNLVAPGVWRYVATVTAIAYPAIAEAVVAYYAWRRSGSMINAYSVWILAWLLILFVVLGLVAIRKRLDGT